MADHRRSPTLTLSAPTRILPQETASSGRAPESDPSYCNAHQRKIVIGVCKTHFLPGIDVDRIIRSVPLYSGISTISYSFL